MSSGLCLLIEETVVVTRLVTFDFYRSYIHPEATGKQLIFVSHIAAVAFGLIAAAISVGLVYAGTSVAFIVAAIAIVIDGAVIPSAFTLFRMKQSKYAVTLVPLLSSVASIGTWIGVVYHRSGVISIATRSGFILTVAKKNLLALLAPVELTPLITYIKLENYDFEKFKELKQVDDTAFAIDIKDGHLPIKTAMERTEEELQNHEAMETEPLSAMNIALGLGLFIAISTTILWPIPIYGSSYVFSKNLFAGWIVVTSIWAFFGAITITYVPLWESRKQISLFFQSVLSGQRTCATTSIGTRSRRSRISAWAQSLGTTETNSIQALLLQPLFILSRQLPATEEARERFKSLA
ncbi:putative urea active transporter protein [Seiridium cardinale]